MSSKGAQDNSFYEEIKMPHIEKFSFDDNACYAGIPASSHPARRALNARRPTQKGKHTKMAFILLLVLVVTSLLCTASACVGFVLEISKLKSKMVSPELIEQTQRICSSKIEDLSEETSMSTDTIEQELRSSVSAFDEKIQQLNSSIDQSNQQFGQAFSALDIRTQQLDTETQLLFDALGEPGKYSFHPLASCAALPIFSPSGDYWVRTSNGSAVRVYCDMTRSCRGVTGGWTRVAELDMTNSSHQCPGGFTQQQFANRSTCIPTRTSCSSITFPSAALQYSSVCGRITAYQVGSTDAFFHHQLNINSHYVDGVSLTHGDERVHIWTFASAHDETTSLPESNCPCTNSDTADRAGQPPEFVGEDSYFCDTGSENRIINDHFYGNDPLWDGDGCGPLSTCCSFNNPPWFYKQLQPTTDDIEMRVCRSSTDENIATEIVQIYIQ
jgi:dynein heavy chain